MSPSGRRWAWNLGRLGLTLLAGVVVWRMIQFHDTVRAEGAVGEAREIVPRGERTSVVWATGVTGDYASQDVSVVKRGFLSLFGRIHKGLFFAMVAALLAPTALLALRWWLLLRGHGFEVPYGQVFFMTYAGTFFNKFLPGSVGGDLTRALLAVQGEERKAAVVGTVILDRVIGLAVMIVLGAACMTPFVGRFEDKRLAVVVYGLFGAMVLGYLVYFSPFLRRRLGDRLPFRKTRQELDGVFRSAREKKGLVGASAAISAASQASAICIIYGLARAMGLEGVDLWVFFVFEPIIFIGTAIPISVGGWGVQELLYGQLFGKFGGVDPNQAIALSILFNISQILVSIPGGLLFAMGTTRKSQVPGAKSQVEIPPSPPGGAAGATPT